MSPEERELLDKSVALAQENNKMLHSVVRSMRITRIISIIYWVIIVGSALGAYYFIQPYVDELIGIYSGAKSSLDDMGSLFE